MENRTALLEKLKASMSLLRTRDSAQNVANIIEGKIADIEKQNETGVPYQQWYVTDNAEKTKKAINDKLYSKKVRKRTPCIVTLPVCGVLGFYAMFWQVAIGVILMIMAIVALVLLIVVQKTGGTWSNEHYEQLKKAEQQDAENTRLNLQKKAALETELRKRNEGLLKSLNKELSEARLSVAKCNVQLDELGVLGQRDRQWRIAYALIEIVESNRANTLQDALRAYDEQKHREEMLRAQLAAGELLKQIAETEAYRLEEIEQLRADMLRREQAEAEHRQEMERLAQKQIDELERKRKADDDYRRSGYIQG